MAYLINSGQYLFDKTLKALWISLKFSLKLITYLPLWFAGYLITSLILQKNDDGLAWIGLIILFAILIYQIVFFIKGIIIGLKNKGNLIWLPLFILCLSFTCLLPTWLVYKNIQPYFNKVSPASGNVLTWIVSISFGLYAYSRYHYLTNIVPLAASLSYQLGISFVSRSLIANTGYTFI